MDTFSVLLISGFVIFGVVVAVALITHLRVSQKKLKETLVNVLGDPELQWDEKNKTFQWQGMNCRYEKYDGSKNSPPSFSIFVECGGTGGGFEVWQESAWERFFKNIGMTREIQTGDDAFDRRFYIDSNTPEFARECFASGERREAVRRLLDMKAEKITYQGKTLSIEWTGSSAHADGIAHLKEAIESLTLLAKDLPLYHESTSSVMISENRPSYRVAVIIVAGASLALGFFSWIWNCSAYPLFNPWGLFVWTLKFSIPALVIFLFYAARTLSGNSRSHRDFLLAASLALSGFLFLGYGVAGLYNGMSDTADPAQHISLVLNKEVHTHKNSRSYHLYVQSWQSGQVVEDLTVNSTVYQRVVPRKDRVLVRTKPGKLGFEWLVSSKVL